MFDREGAQVPSSLSFLSGKNSVPEKERARHLVEIFFPGLHFQNAWAKSVSFQKHFAHLSKGHTGDAFQALTWLSCHCLAILCRRLA